MGGAGRDTKRLYEAMELIESLYLASNAGTQQQTKLVIEIPFRVFFYHHQTFLLKAVTVQVK